jgi:hypothetical protein
VSIKLFGRVGHESFAFRVSREFRENKKVRDKLLPTAPEHTVLITGRTFRESPSEQNLRSPIYRQLFIKM